MKKFVNSLCGKSNDKKHISSYNRTVLNSLEHVVKKLFVNTSFDQQNIVSELVDFFKKLISKHEEFMSDNGKVDLFELLSVREEIKDYIESFYLNEGANKISNSDLQKLIDVISNENFNDTVMSATSSRFYSYYSKPQKAVEKIVGNIYVCLFEYLNKNLEGFKLKKTENYQVNVENTEDLTRDFIKIMTDSMIEEIKYKWNALYENELFYYEEGFRDDLNLLNSLTSKRTEFYENQTVGDNIIKRAMERLCTAGQFIKSIFDALPQNKQDELITKGKTIMQANWEKFKLIIKNTSESPLLDILKEAQIDINDLYNKLVQFEYINEETIDDIKYTLGIQEEIVASGVFLRFLGLCGRCMKENKEDSGIKPKQFINTNELDYQSDDEEGFNNVDNTLNIESNTVTSNNGIETI